MITTITEPWADYELLATGNGRRLERFGTTVLERPDPNVIWSKDASPTWKSDLRFGAEGWSGDRKRIESGWNIRYKHVQFHLKPTPFRHVGIFPEQQMNWDWLEKILEGRTNPRVLNLFAYTGAASLVAALSGAEVCHVDASKGSLHWGKENAALSKLPDDRIRWIADDAVKFMAREVRRGNKYDVILMDPPVFGRGPKGEIFRIEEQISELLQLTHQLFRGENPAFLLNFYATSLYPESIERLTANILGSRVSELSLHSLCLRETSNGNLLPTGFFIRS